MLTNQSGQVVWQADYETFGMASVNEDPDGDGTNVALNIRFPGQYYDEDTRLHYNHFRDYDPATGRYLQSDPIGLEGGLNTYVYVGNNPIRYIDPLGLWRWPEDIYDDAVLDAQHSGLPGPHNGPQDAYRHCLASCESSRENGGLATECIAWANEKKGDWERGQEQGERAMDDHNNSIGIKFGETAKSYNE